VGRTGNTGLAAISQAVISSYRGTGNSWLDRSETVFQGHPGDTQLLRRRSAAGLRRSGHPHRELPGIRLSGSTTSGQAQGVAPIAP